MVSILTSAPSGSFVPGGRTTEPLTIFPVTLMVISYPEFNSKASCRNGNAVNGDLAVRQGIRADEYSRVRSRALCAPDRVQNLISNTISRRWRLASYF